MFEAAQKLRSLKDRGKVYKKVKLGPDNLEVELGLISSADEMEVNTYSEDYENSSKPLAIKVAILSHAISNIMGVELRDKKFVETGQFGPDGTAIKKQKHLFLREILETWSPAEIDTLFIEYVKMVPTNGQDSITLVKVLTDAMLSVIADEGKLDEDAVEGLKTAIEVAEQNYRANVDNPEAEQKTKEAAEKIEKLTDQVNEVLEEKVQVAQPRPRAGFVPPGTYGAPGNDAAAQPKP